MFRERQIVPSDWRQTAFAALSLLFLVPVPVFATYTLGTWVSVSNPDGWSLNSTSGLDLALTPAEGAIVSGTRTFIFAAPLTSGSSTTASATTSNFNAFFVANIQQTAGLQVVIGFDSTNNPAGDPSSLIYKNNNMFNTGT